MNIPIQNNELYLTNSSSSLLDVYTTLPETNQFAINENDRFMPFVIKFKYLRSMNDFILNNSIDTRNRITSANKAIGTLSFI